MTGVYFVSSGPGVRREAMKTCPVCSLVGAGPLVSLLPSVIDRP